MAYGTDTELSEYLASMGLELPADAPPLDVLRQIGSSYLDAAYEYALQCSRRTGGLMQELAWPRIGHSVGGELIADDLIPPQWVKASYRAAYLSATVAGWGIATSDPNRQVKRQKVDTIEREFFDANQQRQADTAAGIVGDGIINGLVKPLLCSSTRSLNSFMLVV